MPPPNLRDLFYEDIGSRLEPMVNDHLIDRTSGAMDHRLHRPTPRDVALICDRPWEGSSCGYISVWRDENEYRMYYRGSTTEGTKEGADGSSPVAIACATSSDGIHWERPNLGVCEFKGSKKNNIVFTGIGSDYLGLHGFTPFRDNNPEAPRSARYKAVGAPNMTPNDGLYAMQSSDGWNWSLLHPEPIITEGRFDSQNLAFWDAQRGEYRAYFRDSWRGETTRFRDIKTCTSPDFVHWSKPQWLHYPGARAEALYTNQVSPYFRAPHIYLGFPTRYFDRGLCPGLEPLSELEERWKLMQQGEARCGTALTDGLFMSSRDGVVFHRWDEAFLRPGPQVRGNWVYGDNYQAWGIIETPSAVEHEPDELSIFATENYQRDPVLIRRYSLRVDGFASMHAAGRGGEFTTHPIRFSGDTLFLNFSTAASGGIRIEVQDAQGTPFNGFHLHEAPEIFGDSLAYPVFWKDGASLAQLQDKTIRLRFVMKDADLYALRFSNG